MRATVDPLQNVVVEAFSRRFEAFLDQARSLSAELSPDEFWTRPYAYGNSVGHLLLHITGNLNYYIGARIAGTGYVRNRPLEFSDASRRAPAAVLADLTDAVAMVVRTARAQTPAEWAATYSAVGTDEVHRFGMFLRCAHHFHHHLGQILYLVKEHAVRREG